MNDLTRKFQLFLRKINEGTKQLFINHESNQDYVINGMPIELQSARITLQKTIKIRFDNLKFNSGLDPP
ncbi:MAG: hypothetical protein FK730_04095 [Asgard group archaeon]|nr:hypothetical protein [Asgard group archaeon]